MLWFGLHWFGSSAQIVQPTSNHLKSKPNQSEPNQSEPNQSEPNQSRPNQSKPNQSKPNQSNWNFLKSPRAPWSYFWSPSPLTFEIRLLKVQKLGEGQTSKFILRVRKEPTSTCLEYSLVDLQKLDEDMPHLRRKNMGGGGFPTNSICSVTWQCVALLYNFLGLRHQSVVQVIFGWFDFTKFDFCIIRLFLKTGLDLCVC